MADTTAQMNSLKHDAFVLVQEKGHDLGAYKEYAGGAVSVAECQHCTRYAWVEIYPTGHDVRGSAFQLNCTRVSLAG